MSLAQPEADFAQYLATLPTDEHRLAVKRAQFASGKDTPDELLGRTDVDGYSAELVGFDTIAAKRTDWLWQGRVPRGMLSLLIGTEGLGKSALTLRLAALLSRGELPGDFRGDPSDVALVTVEDDPGRVMRPRLEAAGADLPRVKHFRLSKGGHDEGLILPRDAGRLGRLLAEADVRLVIIDPLAGTLDPRLNSYKDTDVREALTPLVTAAAEHDFAVLGVLHTNKTKTNDARERAMGSVGWRQVVRSALYLGVDPDDPDGKAGAGRAIAHDKCNVGRLARSVRMRLEEATVQVEGRPATLPRAELGEECDYRASAYPVPSGWGSTVRRWAGQTSRGRSWSSRTASHPSCRALSTSRPVGGRRGLPARPVVGTVPGCSSAGTCGSARSAISRRRSPRER